LLICLGLALANFPMSGVGLTDRAPPARPGSLDPEVGARLGLSRRTTSNDVSAILTKLQVRDRSAAAERACGVGL
jgi:hypothetical protein